MPFFGDNVLEIMAVLAIAAKVGLVMVVVVGGGCDGSGGCDWGGDRDGDGDDYAAVSRRMYIAVPRWCAVTRCLRGGLVMVTRRLHDGFAVDSGRVDHGGVTAVGGRLRNFFC